jgi:hypothetical protein
VYLDAFNILLHLAMAGHILYAELGRVRQTRHLSVREQSRRAVVVRAVVGNGGAKKGLLSQMTLYAGFHRRHNGFSYTYTHTPPSPRLLISLVSATVIASIEEYEGTGLSFVRFDQIDQTISMTPLLTDVMTNDTDCLQLSCRGPSIKTDGYCRQSAQFLMHQMLHGFVERQQRDIQERLPTS